MLIAIADPAPAKLSTGNNLTNQTRATSTASMLVDAYSTAVLTQAPFNIGQMKDPDKRVTDLFTSVNTNLTAAQEHCTDWNHTVKPLLIQTNSDLIDFSNNFDSFYLPLVNLAKDISSGNNRATFVSGLQILGGKIAQKQQNAAGALDTLQTFQSNVLKDQGNFKANLDSGNAIFCGASGEIEKLTDYNSSLQQGMNNDMMMVGFGATGIIVGGLIIACGVLLEFETAGLSTGLIVAGIAVAGGGTAAMVTGAVEYSKALAQYKANLVQIATDKAELAALNGMHDQISNLVTVGHQAVGALQSMVSTWQTLGTQFKNVIDQVNATAEGGSDPSFDAWLVAELQTAKTDWDDVATTAKLIQQQCSNLPVSNSTAPATLAELFVA